MRRSSSLLLGVNDEVWFFSIVSWTVWTLVMYWLQITPFIPRRDWRMVFQHVYHNNIILRQAARSLSITHGIYYRVHGRSRIDYPWSGSSSGRCLSCVELYSAWVLTYSVYSDYRIEHIIIVLYTVPTMSLLLPLTTDLY